MDRLLLATYQDPRSRHNPPDPATLLSILEIEGDSLADSLHSGRKRLEGLVSVRVDNPTSIVTVKGRVAAAPGSRMNASSVSGRKWPAEDAAIGWTYRGTMDGEPIT